MKRRSLELLLAGLSSLLVLLAGEVAVRWLDGYRLASLELLQRQATAVKNPAAAELTRHLAGLEVGDGLERDWFLEDPPNPRRGRVPDPALQQIWSEVGEAELLNEAMYQWNLRLAVQSACQGPPARADRLRRLGRFFYFTPTADSPYPAFRFLQSAYDPSELVTNSFGWRSPEIAFRKPADTVRIAFVGASTTVSAHAAPFSYPEHVGYWLERWARAEGLPVRFEVINAGRSGIASRDIASVVSAELLPVEPDLVIFYEGSNQFWPTAFVTWPDGSTPPPRTENVERQPGWERYSAIYARALLAVDRYVHRVGLEPDKPEIVVDWPADLDEREPDLRHPQLPLNLPSIFADLDAVRASLSPIGGELVLSSFVWLVADGLALELPRDRSLYNQLNQTFGRFPYAHIRRMADFQNRSLERYAAQHDLEFIDLAADFPKDPRLFYDAIHMRPSGIRLRGWLITQALIPILRERLHSGRLPRPAATGLEQHPAFREQPEPEMTWEELLARCNPQPAATGGQPLDTVPEKPAKALRALHAGPPPTRLALYEEPLLEVVDDGVRLSSAGATAGLYLHYRLDPAGRYEVSFTGHRAEGSPTLRVRLDDAAPHYHEAPHATQVFRVQNTESLELLVYADTPFTYELRGISIGPCPDCREAADLALAPPAEVVRLQRLLGPLVAGESKPEVQPYQAPVLEADEAGLRLSGTGEPAGIHLRYRLPPGRRYWLTVDGSAIDGTTTLRLRRGGPEPEYRPAPSGEQLFLVSGTEELELLLYADREFVYLLREIRLEECTTCRSDEDLRRELLDSIPGLAAALERDRLAAAGLLLDWASNHVDFVGIGRPDALALTRYSDRLIQTQSAAEIAEMFESNRAAVFCGGASVYYDKILRLFGFDSFTVNFGDLCRDLTHVTVIVAVPAEEGWDHYLFDPTFNARLLHRSSGRDASLGEVLAMLAGGDISGLILSERPAPGREHIFLDRSDLEHTKTGTCEPREYRTGQAIACLGVSYDFAANMRTLSDRFDACGYTADLAGFLSLMQRRFFSVAEAPNAEASDAFRRLLTVHRVPVGDP